MQRDAGTVNPRVQHLAHPRLPPLLPAGVQGTFQLSVQQDGPAERAGVPAGSWLLELNGASVRSYSRTQLARKVLLVWGGGGAEPARPLSTLPFPSSLSRAAAR